MKLTRVVTFAIVLIALAACSGNGGDVTSTTAEPANPTTQATDTQDPAGDASITISNFLFSGATSVPVGTTVTVTNEDDVSHTWTSEEDVFDSGSLGQGESFEFTFEEAGEYAFVCSIHPGMSGSISVEG